MGFGILRFVSSEHMTDENRSSPKVSTHGILNSSPRSSVTRNSTAASADSASHQQDEISRAPAPIPAGAAGDRLHPPVDVNSDQIQRSLVDGVLPKRPASPTTALGGNDFHVFTWLNVAPWKQSNNGSNINFRQLKEDLEDMDYFLSHKTTLVERIAYKECPEVSRLEVYSLLEQEERNLVESAVEEQKQDEKKPRIYELRVDIVNAAESIFQFFLPSLFEGPTVLKYWGVIHQLLVVSYEVDIQACLLKLLVGIISRQTRQQTKAFKEKAQNRGGLPSNRRGTRRD